MDIRFIKAKVNDSEKLADVSQRAFENDINYGSTSIGGPPGYKSPLWQGKMMRLGDYYKILADKQIIGGMIVFEKGIRDYELGRIFLAPEYQNQGIGVKAFDFLWKTYYLGKRWTLGTPAWNLRNRHFYKKVGFLEIGEDGHGGILFERKIPVHKPT